MNLQQSQAKIAELIKIDAEAAILKAIEFKPSIAGIVADTRKAHGTIQGVAAIALKLAMQGSGHDETIANIIKLAESISHD